jgi:D-aminopeptidase
MKLRSLVAVIPLILTAAAPALGAQSEAGNDAAARRPRARQIGIAPGVLEPGPLNAITDVEGVRVGQVTIVEGDDVRTGITAILPHGGNLYFERVPAALHVGNGFGKLIGSTQLIELGELETPILLTCTLCVWKAADALVDWLLQQPGMARVGSLNPVVGETNDGWLNAIRARAIDASHVRDALAKASGGPVQEGSVGAGTGTIAFDWKGGIGTSSRRTPGGWWTVGVLVQSNFGGDLQILGVPVGRELGRSGLGDARRRNGADGSIMIVVATDAPLSDRNLQRLAARAMLGLGRTGAAGSNGSGDYVIAFSTSKAVRRKVDARAIPGGALLNDRTSDLFQAAIEATEEAIYNSLLRATAIEGNGHRVDALPVDEVRGILKRHGLGGE